MFFSLKIVPWAKNNGKSSNSPSQHSSILKIATFRNTEFVNLEFYETVDTNGDFVFRSFRVGQLVCLLFPHTNFKNVRFVLTTLENNETVNKKRCDLVGVHVESSVEQLSNRRNSHESATCVQKHKVRWQWTELVSLTIEPKTTVFSWKAQERLCLGRQKVRVQLLFGNASSCLRKRMGSGVFFVESFFVLLNNFSNPALLSNVAEWAKVFVSDI